MQMKPLPLVFGSKLAYIKHNKVCSIFYPCIANWDTDKCLIPNGNGFG